MIVRQWLTLLTHCTLITFMYKHYIWIVLPWQARRSYSGNLHSRSRFTHPIISSNQPSPSKQLRTAGISGALRAIAAPTDSRHGDSSPPPVACLRLLSPLLGESAPTSDYHLSHALIICDGFQFQPSLYCFTEFVDFRTRSVELNLVLVSRKRILTPF